MLKRDPAKSKLQRNTLWFVHGALVCLTALTPSAEIFSDYFNNTSGTNVLELIKAQNRWMQCRMTRWERVRTSLLGTQSLTSETIENERTLCLTLSRATSRVLDILLMKETERFRSRRKFVPPGFLTPLPQTDIRTFPEDVADKDISSTYACRIKVTFV